VNILVNDEPLQIEEPATVAALLARLNLGKSACAVEVNRDLVPKSRHGEKTLAEGDRVEIVTLVGGG
jgi:sulfur carrier protein